LAGGLGSASGLFPAVVIAEWRGWSRPEDDINALSNLVCFGDEGEEGLFPALVPADPPRDVVGAPRLPPGAREPRRR
jgi:hypothetical protein